MPFTPVHTLVTLPFIRIKPQWVSATALIIGSMAPDFEYFLTMQHEKHHGHTWLGSLYFDVPMTILAAFAFHLIIKKNLIQNLPIYFQKRLQSLLNFDFADYFRKHYLIFIASAWAGTWSHFFLDSFTHHSGFFVRHLHYGDVMLNVFGSIMPLYIALQMSFSVLGLVALVAYLFLLKPTAHPTLNYTIDFKYWVSFSAITVLLLSLHYGLFSLNLDISSLIIPTITALVGSLIICGFFKFDNVLMAKM